MRNAFADEITNLASTNDKIVLLSGDIGNRLFDKFKEIATSRFYNCGVAEANMIGVASGLGMSGLRPVTYTITPFTTTRCFEQIRIDVCYHQSPVIIVGTGSGLSYADLGPTHHSLEDLAILRTLPGIQILAPCDSYELRALLRMSLNQKKPVYIRIGKKGEPNIYDHIPEIQIGKASIISSGKDICLIASGTIMSEVLHAKNILQNYNISCEVASFHTVKPLDIEYLFEASKRFKNIITIEEHGSIGGLGSSVSEWICLNQANIDLLSLGTPDEFMHEVGSQSYARKKYLLDAQSIVDKVLRRLGK